VLSLWRVNNTPEINVHFHTKGLERIPEFRVMVTPETKGKRKVAGKQYLMRQAAILLKLAKSTSDPQVVPLRLALRRDTYGRDDFSPNGRHSAIVNPGPRWVNRVVLTDHPPLPVYPD
jgi:hypothetical protein